MNKKIVTSETLRLQETENGYDLFIITTEKVQLKIKNGNILNELSKTQIEFVKDHAIYGKLITHEKL